MREAIKELKEAIKREDNGRNQKRLLAVLYHQLKYSNVRIAELLVLSVNTVAIYIRRYNEGGIEWLCYSEKPSGRPKRLTLDQETQFKETICRKTPDELGFKPHKNWTLEIMIAYIKREYGVTYATSGMWDLTQRLRLSWTRPTYVLAKADPEKQAAFLDEFEDIKKPFEQKN